MSTLSETLAAKVIVRETYDENKVSLDELGYDNRRMRINYGNLWVSVYFDGDNISVYYYDRNIDNSKVPSCCKAPGRYCSRKSAETQIKRFFRNW